MLDTMDKAQAAQSGTVSRDCMLQKVCSQSCLCLLNEYVTLNVIQALHVTKDTNSYLPLSRQQHTPIFNYNNNLVNLTIAKMNYIAEYLSDLRTTSENIQEMTNLAKTLSKDEPADNKSHKNTYNNADGC